MLRFFPSTSFLAGATIASPFMADITSWTWAILLLSAWAVSAIATKSLANPLKSPIALWLMVAIVLAHLAALALSDTPFLSDILTETRPVAVLIFVASLTKDDGGMAEGFFAVIIGVALGTAMLGLVKLGLQDRGYLLSFIVDACPGQYPQGSSLCTDYNLLGMLWLVAAIGLVGWRVRTSRVLPLLILPIVIAAGLAVGSRRFLMLAPIVPIFWMGLKLWSAGFRGTGKELSAVAITCLAGWALVSAVSDPASFERFRFGEEPMTILGAPPLTADDVRAPNRAGVTVIGSTIDEGLTSRMDKWELGWSYFVQNPLNGVGFGYHQDFSNKFVKGEFRDYPHLPILSEAIIGGVPLLLVTLALFAILVLRVFGSPLEAHLTGVPAAFLLVTAVTSISGDTVFSIPQWTSVALALMLVQGQREGTTL